MTTSIPNDAHTAAAQAYLKTQGVTLSPNQLRELAARLQGYPDFPAMKAALMPSEEDMARVCSQYAVATHESGDIARALVERIGLEAAMLRWKDNDEFVIRLGPCVVRSAAANGFWNEHQGWVFDKRSATGYPADRDDNWSALAPDAELVAYDTAVDFPNG
jgi:hypothetical protein